MGIVKSFVYCLRNYFTFSGRGGRSEFWWFKLTASVFIGIASRVGELEALLFTLLFLIPDCAAGSRRLHDTGKSGWWQLLHIVPVIGSIVLIYLFVQKSEPRENQYGPPLNADGLPEDAELTETSPVVKADRF